MNIVNLIQPKKISVSGQDGSEKEFIISKFPALDGREIVSQYTVSAIPKIGEYKTNETMALKMLSFAAVEIGEGDHKMTQRLITRELVNSHVPDFEMLIRLEKAILEYNVSFFTDGRASTFFDAIAQKAQALLIQIATQSKPQS